MFGFEKTGVGIPKNAPKKKGILRFFELFFRKFWKLIEVNLLYSVFFIPLALALYAILNVSSVTVTVLMTVICMIVFVLTILKDNLMTNLVNIPLTPGGPNKQ